MINPEVAVPLTIAFATPVALVYRWLQHRERMAAIASGSAGKAGAQPSADAERLERLERAVEAIALEVERVGEGQRYLTRVLADRPMPVALPASQVRTNTPH